MRTTCAYLVVAVLAAGPARALGQGAPGPAPARAEPPPATGPAALPLPPVSPQPVELAPDEQANVIAQRLHRDK